jgi:hypothetical protein
MVKTRTGIVAVLVFLSLMLSGFTPFNLDLTLARGSRLPGLTAIRHGAPSSTPTTGRTSRDGADAALVSAAVGGAAVGTTAPPSIAASRSYLERGVDPPGSGSPATVAWGAYIPGAPQDMSLVTQMESQAGKHIGIVMWYEHWSGPWAAFHAPDFQNVLAHGSMPMVTWMSDDVSNGPNQPAFSNAQVTGGTYDGYIQSWADGLRSVGQPVLVRLDSEMNGRGMPWADGVNGNATGSFVAMWRHVHDIFVRQGASNVKWVWSPNVDFSQATETMANMYPGDAYVDWLALDGYNWGTTTAFQSWQSFSQIFASSVSQITGLSSRPLMIAETATIESGASGQTKAAWIESAFSHELQNFPQVKAVVWFDQDNGAQDWRLETSSASIGAFASAIQSPRYKTSF